MAAGRWRLGRAFHHQRKQRESRKQQRQQEEHVGEGHDDPLPVHNCIELLQRHGMRVAPVGREPLRQVVECLQRRLLINCTHGTVLRLLPALTLTDAQLDEGCGILEECLLAYKA